MCNVTLLAPSLRSIAKILAKVCWKHWLVKHDFRCQVITMARRLPFCKFEPCKFRFVGLKARKIGVSQNRIDVGLERVRGQCRLKRQQIWPATQPGQLAFG